MQLMAINRLITALLNLKIFLLLQFRIYLRLIIYLNGDCHATVDKFVN